MILSSSPITPIHELGHAGFAIALGGRVTELRLGPFSGYCRYEGLEGTGDAIARAGGIISTLAVGICLLIAYRRITSFPLRFFSFCLLSFLILSGIFWTSGPSFEYMISGPPSAPFDVTMIIQRVVPAPVFLVAGLFLIWLVLFPLKYFMHLTFLYKDVVNYVSTYIRVEIKELQ